MPRSSESPGGISNQTGGGQAANVLLVTNSSANTFTTFNISSFTPGLTSLNGPIYISSVVPTGNTPRAISITAPSTGAWNREFAGAGPGEPMILYADHADGVVNTTNLNRPEPIKQFALGVEASGGGGQRHDEQYPGGCVHGWRPGERGSPKVTYSINRIDLSIKGT